MVKGTRLLMAIAATLITQAATFQALSQSTPGTDSAEKKPWERSWAVLSDAYLESESKAAAGDVQSQFDVGMARLAGDGAPLSEELAFQWFERAANNGHANAMYWVGRLYDSGIGISEDRAAAAKWYMKSAENGVLLADNRMGFMHKLGIGVAADPMKAAHWFGRAAASGESEAQFELGLAYRDGTGVIQDSAMAAFWFEKSASQGNVWGQLQIGLANMYGRGVPKDPAGAVGWYKMAADQGNALGQYWLGQAYELGQGVSRNPNLAARWYRLAADQGSQFAQADLGFLYAEGIGVAKDEREAFRLFELSAAESEPRGQFGLATMYADGRVVKQNHQNAFSLYRLAAEQGYAPAQDALGSKYATGEGVPQNFREAYNWYRLAADKGHRQAQYNLAVSYVNGEGVPQNFEEAYFWSSLAAAEDYSKAVELRDYARQRLSTSAVSRAQSKAASWKPNYTSKAASDGEEVDRQMSNWESNSNGLSSDNIVATGSAFVISAAGHVVTNAHVVSACSRVTLPNGNVLSVLGIDEGSDLALLKISGSNTGVPLGLRSGRGVQLGEDVVIAGFPLSGLLSSDLNVTAGSVSSLSGPGQDRRIFQLTAPVQSGNSGGPVLDMSGNVVGVVVAKLDALAVAEAVGDVPQNVNFAISLGILQSFLDSFGVDYSMKGSTAVMSRPKVAETARTATVQVECRS